jgi:hypothetical protein
MTVNSCVLPKSCLPSQYLSRAAEAQAIFSITEESSLEAIASKIAVAELGQLLCFSTLTILYALGFAGIISPIISGAIAIAILPMQALCSYHTFAHYKRFSKIVLTIAAIITLATCGIFALLGVIKDSTITLCVGGIILHCFRNISERFDSKNLSKNPKYQTQVLEKNRKDER